MSGIRNVRKWMGMVLTGLFVLACAGSTAAQYYSAPELAAGAYGTVFLFPGDSICELDHPAYVNYDYSMPVDPGENASWTNLPVEGLANQAYQVTFTLNEEVPEESYYDIVPAGHVMTVTDGASRPMSPDGGDLYHAGGITASESEGQRTDKAWYPAGMPVSLEAFASPDGVRVVQGFEAEGANVEIIPDEGSGGWYVIMPDQEVRLQVIYVDPITEAQQAGEGQGEGAPVPEEGQGEGMPVPEQWQGEGAPVPEEGQGEGMPAPEGWQGEGDPGQEGDLQGQPEQQGQPEPGEQMAAAPQEAVQMLTPEGEPTEEFKAADPFGEIEQIEQNGPDPNAPTGSIFDQVDETSIQVTSADTFNNGGYAVQAAPPAQEETPPAQEETQPAQEETPPALEVPAEQLQEAAPPAQGEIPAAQGEIPAAQEETQPAPEETQPAQEETQPVQEETQPVQEETQPVQEETEPALEVPAELLQEAAPPAQGEIPAAQEETQPAPEETQPAPEETQPAQEETQPAQEETPPVQEETQPVQEETEPALEVPAEQLQEAAPPAQEETQPAQEETQPVQEAPAEQVQEPAADQQTTAAQEPPTEGQTAAAQQPLTEGQTAAEQTMTGAAALAEAPAAAATETAPPAPAACRVTFANPADVTVTGADGTAYAAAEGVTVPAGTVLNLTANAGDAGRRFVSWSAQSLDPAAVFADPAAVSTQLTVGTADVIVAANYVPLNQAEITSGEGGGVYAEGERVVIEADKPDTGWRFDHWTITGGNPVLEDSFSAKTAFIMPAGPVALEAEYELIEYTLTVSGGKGSGTYTMDEEAPLEADWPAEWKEFDRWVITGGHPDLTGADRFYASLTMPAADVSVKSTYKDGPDPAYNGIEGLESGVEYLKGATLSFHAAGVGMDNTNPNPGDYRYKPTGYQIGSVSGGWQDTNYTTSMAINAVGEYTLTVSFTREVYRDGTWTSDGTVDTRSVSFWVVNALSVQTGDQTPILGLLMAALVSLAVMVLVPVFGRRRGR